MTRVLYRLGRFGGRHPWRLLAIWFVAAIAVLQLNGHIGGSTNETFQLPGSESQQAADALEDRFPQQSTHTSNVVLHVPDGLSDSAVKAAVGAALDRLADVDHMLGVSDPYAGGGESISADGRTGFARVAHDVNRLEVADYDAAMAALEPAAAAGVRVEVDGLLGAAEPRTEASSEIIGLAIAVVVLVIAFGSVVAMSVPLAVALVGLMVGSAGIGILAGFFTVPEITTIVGMMMGLGVGIDYALFILARHRQHLAEGMAVPEAAGRANATAGLSVLFAGLTVIVAIAGLQLTGIPMLTMMGWGAAVMVLVTMLAAITLLPAVLGVIGHKVNALRIPFVRTRPFDVRRTLSGRWVARVVARPVRYGVTAAVLLGVLAAPVFALRIGFPDAGNEPRSTTTRQAYDLLVDGFGPGFNGPFQVVVDRSQSPDDEAVLTAIGDALAATPGIASTSGPDVSEDGDLAVFSASPTTGSQDDQTSEVLDDLRDEVLPAAAQGHDVDVMVTGDTAFETDVSNRIQHRMLWFIGAVIALAFVALTIVFRSVVVPLKAAALNLISIGAAYGVVVAVFQWGWGAELIGVHETVPIMPIAPLLMFAILFGLSMDYEVFLLSRVREYYLAHGDPKRAVVEGTGSTARIITSAALIMISVFFAFVLSSDATTKLFGVGLGVAVFLDVTLVRMVLVPAAMSLLGHRAWWLPAWLDQMLPRIDVEGGLAPVHGGEQLAGGSDDSATEPEVLQPGRLDVLSLAARQD
jgi:RND superfamily putative drug exporter